MKKNIGKKISTIPLLLLLASMLTISSTNDANANMFNKFKKGFYFEKYKTAEEARTALLELHPVGSNVGELVRTLERAGGVENTPRDKKDNGGWDYIVVDKKQNSITLLDRELHQIRHEELPSAIQIVSQSDSVSIFVAPSGILRGEPIRIHGRSGELEVVLQ